MGDILLQTTSGTADSHPAYQRVLEYFMRGRNGRRKVKRATYLYKETEGIAMRFWNTKIVLFKPRSFVIDLDGWRSVTTKDRLREGIFRAAGFRVNLWHESGKYVINCNGHEYLFDDGMEFDYEGNALNASPEPFRKWMEKRERLRDAYWRNARKSVMDIQEVEHELGADISFSLTDWRWNEPPYSIMRDAYPANGHIQRPQIRLPANTRSIAVREAFITKDVKIFKVIALENDDRTAGVYLMGRDQTGQLWCHSLPPFGYALASIQKCERWLFDMQPGDELVAEA
ncbi:MAG: hypothetical protein KIS29_05135 [Thermoplasmata archaeon]|nr:hypothetical protein [Candidatus Sysuiplasma jiujiangense]